MADEPVAEGGEKKSGKMKLIIIAVAGLLVLGGGGFAAYKFFLAKPKPAPAAEGQAPAAEAEAPKEKPAEHGGGGGHEGKGEKSTVMNLEPFVVNLADPGGRRYLKLTLAMDIKDEKLKKDLESRMPMIRDSVLLLLSSKTYNDIASVAGKLKLRTEILKIINNALGSGSQVHELYFSELVIQ